MRSGVVFDGVLNELKSRQPVGKLLVQLGFVSEATLRDALSEKLGLQSVDLSQIVVDPGSIRIVPREFAKRHNLFPVALDKERKRLGPAFWSRRVRRVVDALRPVFVWDRLYIGGGNAEKITLTLSPDVSIIPNTLGMIGGIYLWKD